MTDFKFPPALLSQHIAIVGKTGSGKTYTAKGMVERLLDEKRRVCVLDPTGVWYGLRSSPDGKKAGYPIAVFGGRHADVPIAENSGPAVAKVIATQNLPAIIDLSEMLIGQRHRFVTEFAEALYRENRAPLHLVIDEADEFAPQNPLPETKRMLHHVDRIVRRGRVRGFRVMLITQRPAVLHKNVLTQSNSLIAMRLTAPQDRKALQAWVEGQADADEAREVLNSLARLQRGEGWLWAPELNLLARTTFPKITTFDSGRTPEDDEVVIEPSKLATVDLGEVRASFEAVEQEIRSVKDLAAEVERLRKELASAKARPPSKASTPATPQPNPTLTDAALRAELAAVTRSRDGLQLVLNGWHDRARKIAKTLLEGVGDVAIGTKAPEKLVAAVVRHDVRQEAAAPEPRPRAAAPAPGPVSSGLSSAEQRVLDAIAWWHAAGIDTPTRHQVAFVAGYTVNGHFNNVCGSLRGRGHIEYPAGSCLGLTSDGGYKANAPEAKPTRDDLVRRVTAVLKGEPMRRLFGVLVDARAPLAREELASRCGYTVNGHFNNLCGALNGIGVAEYPAKGTVGLTSIFRGLGNG